jgi:hypothetical protein
MQVSATLIAAQQAAREARARLAMPQGTSQAAAPATPQATAKAGFAAALEKTSGVQAGFSALPLKQTAVPQAPAPAQADLPVRLGQHIDITV